MKWPSKITLPLLGWVIAWLVPASQADTLRIPWQDTAYLEKAFIEIALKNEYRATEQRILKWQKPIRYQIEFRHLPVNPTLLNYTQVHLKHLAKITQHPFQAVKHSANFKIIYTQKAHYQADIADYTDREFAKRIARESHCMGNFSLARDRSIAQGVVIIPVDHAFAKGLFISCLVEETTQLMGLPNDSDWVHPSIANDRSRIELLSPLDYLFLKILYDPRLKAGMPLKQSRPIIQQIIQDLQQQGNLKQAFPQVSQDGLNQLFKD